MFVALVREKDHVNDFKSQPGTGTFNPVLHLLSPSFKSRPDQGWGLVHFHLQGLPGYWDCPALQESAALGRLASVDVLIEAARLDEKLRGRRGRRAGRQRYALSQVGGMVLAQVADECKLGAWARRRR